MKVALKYYLLPFSAQGSHEKLAWECLLKNTTYRLDKAADQQPSIGLRVLYRTLRRIRSGTPAELKLAGVKTHVIYDANHNHAEQKKEYVSAHRGLSPGTYLSKENIVTLINKPLAIALIILVSLPLVLLCFLRKRHRTNRALHISHLAEASALVHFLNKQPNSILYDFAPYHIDSNWLYTLASKFTREYVKLPSPGPLTTHHSKLLSEVLIVTSAYQEYEIDHLANVRCNRIEKWLVERALGYIDLYASSNYQAPPSCSIGYYSHASWLRARENHREIGFDIQTSEETLLRALSEFLATHHDYKLTVFLHPRERKPEVINDTLSYYRQFIAADSFEVSDASLPSAKAFNAVDVSVSALSTILFERLFCGFKTLIWNFGMTDFPLRGSTLETISVNTTAELTKLIEQSARSSQSEFFKVHGLEAYRFNVYPYFSDPDLYKLKG